MFGRRLLRVLFALVGVTAFAACVLPWLLYARSAPFAGRLEATLFYTALVGQKVWAAFLRLPRKAGVVADGDWTVAAVGFSSLVVMYTVLFDLYHRRVAFPSCTSAIVGGALYVGGLGLGLWALRVLGDAWSIQLDRDKGNAGALVRHGPYAWLRHPIYLGAMLDTVGIAVMFDSVWAVVAALVAFCPAEVARARFEERVMSDRLGPAYTAYVREVAGFLPRRRGLSSTAR